MNDCALHPDAEAVCDACAHRTRERLIERSERLDAEVASLRMAVCRESARVAELEAALREMLAVPLAHSAPCRKQMAYNANCVCGAAKAEDIARRALEPAKAGT